MLAKVRVGVNGLKCEEQNLELSSASTNRSVAREADCEVEADFLRSLTDSFLGLWRSFYIATF